MLLEQRKILNDELTRCKIQLSFFLEDFKWNVKKGKSKREICLNEGFNLFKMALDDKSAGKWSAGLENYFFLWIFTKNGIYLDLFAKMTRTTKNITLLVHDSVEHFQGEKSESSQLFFLLKTNALVFSNFS